MHLEQECTWTVTDIQPETPGVFTLTLTSEAKRPDFIAGQYLTIKLPGIGPKEGKAYSIASSPNERDVRITIRTIGAFSSTLVSLAPGATLTTSAPYGFFYPEPEDTYDLALIAGGIGITPCMSIMKHLAETNDPRHVHLFYSNQTERDIIFLQELSALAAQNSRISITHFITREERATANYVRGRMTPQQICRLLFTVENTEFFLCGSMNFTRSLWKQLRDAGIPQSKLYTEGFF